MHEHISGHVRTPIFLHNVVSCSLFTYLTNETRVLISFRKLSIAACWHDGIWAAYERFACSEWGLPEYAKLPRHVCIPQMLMFLPASCHFQTARKLQRWYARAFHSSYFKKNYLSNCIDHWVCVSNRWLTLFVSNITGRLQPALPRLGGWGVPFSLFVFLGF